MFFFAMESRCQDAQFSQFNNTPLEINPSSAGAFASDIRLLANYRDQWSTLAVPYKTFAFSYDMGLRKKKGKTGFLGGGISFLSDKAGSSELGSNQVDLSLAYHAFISDHNTVSAGIMGGFAQRSIDFSKLEWNNQYDPTTNSYNSSLPSNETGYSQNKSYPDCGAGLQWAYSKSERNSITNDKLSVNAGFAVFHVNEPNVSFFTSAKDNLPMKLVLHGSAQIGFLNSLYSLSTSLVYIQQGTQSDIMFGGLLKIKLQQSSIHTGFIKGNSLSVGAYFRTGDAIIPEVLLEMAEYAVGISYDVNTSGLRTATSYNGAFEISLSFFTLNPFANKPKVQNKTLPHTEQ